MENKKIKLVVIDGCNLGYIEPRRIPGMATMANILKASKLKGSTFNDWDTIPLTYRTVRLATEKDFEEFGVLFTGYKDNPMYEYAETTPSFVDNRRWDSQASKEVDTPAHVRSFLEELIELMRKHNISISHEDGHGAFVLERFSEPNADWIGGASLNFEPVAS